MSYNYISNTSGYSSPSWNGQATVNLGGAPSTLPTPPSDHHSSYYKSVSNVSSFPRVTEGENRTKRTSFWASSSSASMRIAYACSFLSYPRSTTFLATVSLRGVEAALPPLTLSMLSSSRAVAGGRRDERLENDRDMCGDAGAGPAPWPWPCGCDGEGGCECLRGDAGA